MRTICLWSLFLISGCTSLPPTTPPPPPRPLAQDLPTFQAETTEERPVRPEVTGDLTLRQALALALLHNPRLEAYAWHVRAREAAILQGRLSPNPVLGLRVENFGGDDALRDFDGAVSTLRLSQAIELGDKRLKRTRLAQREYALAGWDYEAQRLHVIAHTGEIYIDVLAAQENVTLAQQNFKLAEELYRIVVDLCEQGMIPTAEKDKSLVQVTARQIELENQERQLAILRQKLAAQWDAPSAEFQTLTGDLLDLPTPPAYEHLSAHIEQNPDLARWSMEIAARQAAIDLADAHAIPNLTLGAGVRQFNTTDNQALVFEMGIPLPLVNRNQGAKQQARYQLQQSKAQQRLALSQAQTTLFELYQSLMTEHHAATTLENKSLPSARTAFNAAREQFAEGVTDYLNVLDAERTLIATQYKAIAARAGYHKAQIRIEAFLGAPLVSQ